MRIGGEKKKGEREAIGENCTSPRVTRNKNIVCRPEHGPGPVKGRVGPRGLEVGGETTF